MFRLVYIFFIMVFSVLSIDKTEIYLPFPIENPPSNHSLEKELPKSNLEQSKEVVKKESELSKKNSATSNQTTLPILADQNKSNSTNLNAQLPNLGDVKSKNSKKASKGSKDESKPPFDRAGYYMNRYKNETANTELNDSLSKSGEYSPKAQLDKIRLLAQNRKKEEAKGIIDEITDAEQKYKAMFELAIGLDTTAKGKKEKEEAIPYYLWIATDAPKDHFILPKTLWSLANLHYNTKEFLPALDYLSLIILEHPSCEFIDDAVYLSGLIYETGDETVKNLEKAKKYYDIFIQNKNRKHFKDSIYWDEVFDRRNKL